MHKKKCGQHIMLFLESILEPSIFVINFDNFLASEFEALHTARAVFESSHWNA